MNVKDTPNEGQKEWEPISAGTHVATCYAFVDLGEQINPYAKKSDRNKVKRQLLYGFEVDETKKLDDGTEVPKIIIDKCTLSVRQTDQGIKSKLRKILESWCGCKDEDFTKETGLDIDKLMLDKPALLGITHTKREKGGVFENISTISAPLKGMSVPTRQAELVHFEFPTVSEEKIKELSDEKVKAVLDEIEKLPKSFKMQSLVKDSITYKLYQKAAKGDKLEPVSAEEQDALPF